MFLTIAALASALQTTISDWLTLLWKTRPLLDWVPPYKTRCEKSWTEETTITMVLKRAKALFCFSMLSAALTASVAQQTTPAAPVAGSASSRKAAVQNYGKLPMTFEANQGQIASDVKYLSRGPGYVVFLTAGEMVFSAKQPRLTGNSQTANSSVAPQKTTNAVIRLSMVGANPNPVAVGENQQPGKVNYFIGRDKSKWHTNVPTYAKIRYKDIYPGIDLVYYGNPSQMEYDFELAPGANPKQIQFDVKGADSVHVDQNGDLVLETPQGSLHMKSPVLYQTINNMRLPLSGGYLMKNSTRVGFSLSGYDANKPLVIDPVLLYSTYLGGLADDQPVGVAVDPDGSAYVAGWTQSTNFPLASQGGNQLAGTNAFIAKLDVSGSSLVYADYIGGSSEDYALAMTLDGANNAYVSGYTCSGDFPVVNAFQPTMPTCYAGFVSKVSPDGSSLLYSTYLGGSTGETFPNAIAVTPTQEIYLGGWTQSTDFPTQNAFQSTASPNQNNYYGQYGFVTHFSADGSALVFSTYLAGNSNVAENCGYVCWPSPYTSISGLALDSNGNAYVAGNTNTYNFPTTDVAYMASQNNPSDQQIGFVSELSSSGALTYSTYFGLTDGNYTSINAIAVDSNGSAYVAGSTYGDPNFPVTTPNLCDPNTYGWNCGYGFVTKFDPTGSTLSYSTYLPPQNFATPQAITLDAQNNAYIVSQSYSSAMALVTPIENYTNQNDVLLTEIDPTGSNVLFSTFLGGNGYEQPAGIAVDSTGNIYVSGSTNSSDFPVTAAALQNTLGGNTDAFIAKIGTANAPAVAISPSLVQFSIRPVGSVSQPNTALLRNMGSAALTISSITISGDFTETDTCGTNVPAAGTCTFTVTFTPTAPGPRFGSILIQDDGAGSPHFINLVGDGSTAIATLSANSLSFPSLQINQTSSPQTVTLTNNGNATLNLSNIAVSGDYSQTNNCPPALGVGSACTFQLTFTPTAGGARNGGLTLTDNAPDSPQTIALTGSGYVTTTTIAPSALTFSNQSVGTTSSAQTVTVTNTGSNTMTISGVAATGDFSATTTCSTLSASQSCSVNVTFVPTVSGSRSGILTISNDAQGNPHTVSLSGTGTAAAVTFSSTNLTFASQSVGSTSTPQSITVTNTGNGQLTVSSIQVSGDFVQTNNCATVAANGGTCTIQVAFAPTYTGARSGALLVTDSAPNSPQTITLSGGAGAPANTLSASSLTFSAQQVGSSSASKSVTLTNAGNANMVISSVSAVGDFTQTNNCPASLAPSGNCTINIIFAPVAGGSRTGSLIVSDNSLTGPAIVSLSGTGSDFSLAASGTNSATVKAGSNATYHLTFSGVGGPFANSVNLSCAGAPAESTCSVSPTSIAAGSNSATVTVTVTTTASVAALNRRNDQRGWMLASWIFQAPGMLVFGLVSVGQKKRKMNWRTVTLALVIGLALFAVACGGGSTPAATTTHNSQPGTATGTYSLAVTGASGSLIHTAQLTLIVQ
jgi:hypothetical protein